jgi:hypothetical protein
MGQADTAERLSPVGLNWFCKPWQFEQVIEWEAAICEALEVPGLPFKRQLLAALAKVTNWLAVNAPVCHFAPDDPLWGWHLMTDWDDAQPGDILYDGELWMACRNCNWGDGKPLYVPDGAVGVKGYGLSAIPWNEVGGDGD